MSKYALSEAADRDIEDIVSESVERWGWAQAEKYITGLHETFEILVRFPKIGRKIDNVRAGYRRFEHARHSIFYRHSRDGILIVRVLHSRMQPDRHL